MTRNRSLTHFPQAASKGREALGDANALRQARLRRMQALATGLLVLMAVVFVLASVAARRWSWAGYVRAFAEAAMVGGCADWFAVTALFRRPFGLPIPHTAIIPRGKDRIGAALGRFIVENFLEPSVLDAKLQDLELARWGGEWLQRPRNAQGLADRLLSLAPELAGALPQGALEQLAGTTAIALARTVPAAPAASALLAAAWNEGRAQPLIERAAEWLAAYLAEHQEVILEKVQAQSWRWLPSFVDKAIARQITRGLVQLLTDIRQPGHPWRAKLAEVVHSLVNRLAEDPELRRQGEVLKHQLLDDPRLAEHASRLWALMRERLRTGRLDDAGAIRERLQALLCDLGRWLKGDATLQRNLNAGARAVVQRILAPRRRQIGEFVAQVVEGWDARDIVERLELQVGPDLQYIRVNGAVVGGLVGLLLFSASRLLGLV